MNALNGRVHYCTGCLEKERMESTIMVLYSVRTFVNNTIVLKNTSVH